MPIVSCVLQWKKNAYVDHNVFCVSGKYSQNIAIFACITCLSLLICEVRATIKHIFAKRFIMFVNYVDHLVIIFMENWTLYSLCSIHQSSMTSFVYANKMLFLNLVMGKHIKIISNWRIIYLYMNVWISLIVK